MGKAFFISGSGTGIGKTIVTCSLVRQCKEINRKVFAIKPLISGWTNNLPTNDTLQILESLGMNNALENIEKISPWRFREPLAPNMAARKENITINYTDIVNFCKDSIAAHENLFIEGAGGIMSPITDSKTNLDLICDLNIPAILVTGTYLGAISHTLTAIKAVEYASIKIQAIIVNESQGGIGLEETIGALANFTQHKIHGLEIVTQNNGQAWEHTPDLLGLAFASN